MRRSAWRRRGRSDLVVFVCYASCPCFAKALAGQAASITGAAALPGPPDATKGTEPPDASRYTAFSIDEYREFLDALPITRADFSIQGWLGRPRVETVPGFLSRFDWLLDHTDWAHRDPETYSIVKQRLDFFTADFQQRPDPCTVFATPFAVRRLLMSALKDFDSSHNNRTVVFAGSDQLLSEAFGGNPNMWSATTELMRKYFKNVFYMAKDVEVEGVTAMPIGLLEHYLRQDYVAESAKAAITRASLTTSTKRHNILLALGGHGDYKTNKTDMYDARKASFDSRRAARRWGFSLAGQELGVDVRSVKPADWWEELASYRFVVSPFGDGIQAARTIEALFVLTIPIVQRGKFPVHDDLVKLGFPLVVVDDWSEITTPKLHEWWYNLAPRLEAFRRDCLSADGYWRLVTSDSEFPRCGGE
eukprot:TRINITY_DN54583_c0_g1_i1.p1 TRINITY_DN54583_c0_g1~~TRINITY_DN54583_c0_g1_i1.p1  ORF type:complete len:419 (+),score=43.97 TRINITY_DN54583_c0_g1_i1:302-1558(+)